MIKQRLQIFFWGNFLLNYLCLIQRFWTTVLLAALQPSLQESLAPVLPRLKSVAVPSDFSGAGTSSNLELKFAVLRKLFQSSQQLHHERFPISSTYHTVQAFMIYQTELKLKGQKYLLPLGIRSLSGMKSLYPQCFSRTSGRISSANCSSSLLSQSNASGSTLVYERYASYSLLSVRKRIHVQSAVCKSTINNTGKYQEIVLFLETIKHFPTKLGVFTGTYNLGPTETFFRSRQRISFQFSSAR